MRHTLIQLTQINELRHQDPGTLKDTAREAAHTGSADAGSFLTTDNGAFVLGNVSHRALTNWLQVCDFACAMQVIKYLCFKQSNKSQLKKMHEANNQLTRVNVTS